MRRMLVTSAGALVALAVIASNAIASPKVHLFAEDGSVPLGGEKLQVWAEVGSANCFLYEEGTLIANDRGVVRVPVEHTNARECNSGYSVTGKLGTVALEWNGFAKLSNMHLIVEEPGPCKYTVTKDQSFLEIPGFFDFPVSNAKGWLLRAGSNVSCANLVDLPVLAFVLKQQEDPIETELWG